MTAALVTAFALNAPAGAGWGRAKQEPIVAAVQTAVANGHVWQSQLKGFRTEREFNEVPNPGTLLIGFDAGVGRFLNIETVYALRAIFSTPDGEGIVADHGLFPGQLAGGRRDRRSKSLHTVQVRARPGYAVSGMYLRTGLNINGFAVTFMRMKGRVLDPDDSYTSEWVGDRTGGSEEYLGGNGAPAVGVIGTEDEEHVSALGLVFADLPPVPAAPPPNLKRLFAAPPGAASLPAPSAQPVGVPVAPVPDQNPVPVQVSEPDPRTSRGSVSPVPMIALAALALGVITVCAVVGQRQARQRQAQQAGAGGDEGVVATPAGGTAGAGVQMPLANRVGSITATVAGGVFITCIAPRVWTGPGFHFDEMICAGVVGGLAGGVGWVIGKAIELARR
jgi:hypothetical protein